MPEFEQYQISLEVDDKPLHEYNCPEEQSNAFSFHEASSKNMICKYVEVAEGARFTIRIHIDGKVGFRKGSNAKRVQVYFGNSFVRGSISYKQQIRDQEVWTLEGSLTQLSDGPVLQPFQFEHLLTTEELRRDTDLEHVARMLGYICVAIGDAKSTNCKRNRVNPLKQIPSEVVPVKALMGQPVELGTTLGSPEPLSNLVTCDARDVGQPVVSFIFKYRTRQGLQTLGVIPTTPVPLPLEERNPDSLTLEEARELVKRLQSVQPESIKGVKSEKVKKEERIKVEIKDEFGRYRQKRAQGIAVDEDSDECCIVEAKKVRVEVEFDEVELSD